MTIAALPMYDLAELQDANDALWAAIQKQLASRGVAAPKALTRDMPLDRVWRHPSLLLAQTCGYPLMTGLRGLVRLVATPRYRAQGCDGAWHRSALIVSADQPARALAELRASRCAINGADSNTGMNLFRASVAQEAGGAPFFTQVLYTGSHLASLAAVAEGHADIAAIDAVTYAHARRLYPELTRAIRVLSWTQESPSLPLITALSTPQPVVEALREALTAVAADPALAAVRDALLIDGFECLPEAAYEVVLELDERAAATGYPELV